MAKRKINEMTKKRHNLLGYLFLSPWLIGFLIFTIYPFFYTIYMSFHTVTVSAIGISYHYVELNNYINALFKDTYDWGRATFTGQLFLLIMNLIVYVPTVTLISLILALLLNQKIKFRGFIRTIYFLPVIILSGPVLSQFMDTGSSSIEGIEYVFVYRIIDQYSREIAQGLRTLFSNFALVLWFTGIPIVLYINGLQKINKQLYEAAQIDGATAWQSLWKITLPILKPIAMVVAVFTIVQIGTSPLNPAQWILDITIANHSDGQGKASAYAWIYSIIMLGAIGLAVFLLSDRSKNEMIVDIASKQEKRINKMIKRNRRKKLFNPKTFKATLNEIMNERHQKRQQQKDILTKINKGE